jgi:hypothetical protein
MTKPMAWTGVVVGLVWIVLGALQLVLRLGPWPGAFLVLGLVYLLCSVINLKRIQNAYPHAPSPLERSDDRIFPRSVEAETG